jgi:nucleotide-binding universal stress UspA family protein
VSILVGYVHTSEGAAALERAVQEARDRATQLHVVRVLQEPTTDDPTQHRDWSQALDQARDAATRLEQQLTERGIDVSVELVVTSRSSPADVLLELSARDEVELLVIGMRRRSRVGKLVLGSAAQQLLLHAEVPVLAVKPEE